MAPELTGDLWIDVVESGGGEVVPIEQAGALVWIHPDDPEGLRRILESHGDHLDWVQLPFAGINPYVPLLDVGPGAATRLWTCAKGAYAEPVAELALTLALACMRGIDRYARSTTWRQYGELGVNLAGARVSVLGGGGITEVLLRLLGPWGSEVTVARNRQNGLAGARRVLGSSPEEIDEAVPDADPVSNTHLTLPTIA